MAWLRSKLQGTKLFKTALKAFSCLEQPCKSSQVLLHGKGGNASWTCVRLRPLTTRVPDVAAPIRLAALRREMRRAEHQKVPDGRSLTLIPEREVTNFVEI